MKRFFANNEHWMERIFRVALGTGLLSLAVTGQTAWGFLGVVPLLTGVVGNCPVYSLLGISTCPLKHRNSRAPQTGN